MSKIFYSPSVGGFFLNSGPSDAVQISHKLHDQLLKGQSAGKHIVAGADGVPELQEPEVQDEAELLAARRAQMVASKLQAKKALEAAGRWAEVKAALATDADLQEDWDLAYELRRTSPLVTAFASALSPVITDEELDALFAAAAAIDV